ncbi:MAG: hypothetical protein ACK4E8_00730 [Lacibacter sp.]
MRALQNISLTVLLLLQIVPIQAQWQQQATQTARNLDSFYRFNPLEKCYLHTDKDWYFPGETIWFRLYLLVDDEPGNLSGVIYVDLSNDSGKVVAKSMWKNEGAGHHGDLLLPRNLPPGLYRLRAYTLYMLNTPEAVFEKFIRIADENPTAWAPAAVAGPLQVHLQPEGGRLLAGFENKLGYALTAANGYPAAGAVLVLKNQQLQVVATDTANETGLGSFTITPNEQDRYTLTISHEQQQQIVTVPTVSTNGVLLRSNNAGNRIFVSVHTRQLQLPSVIILAQMNGVVVYAQEYPLEEGSAAGAIDTRKLPRGVLHIICMDTQQQVLSERLVFVNHATEQPLQVQAQLQPQPKSPVAVTITGLTDSSLLSVAITDAEPVWLPRHNPSLPEYLHHTNSNTRYVTQRSVFFQATEASRKATDLLLLVLGKARYDTQKMVLGQMPNVKYLPQTGIEVQGTVTSTTPLPKDSRINLILKTEDSTTIFTDAQLRGGNRFAAGALDFRKQARLFVKEAGNRAANTTIHVDPAYIDTLQQLAPFTGIVRVKDATAATQDPALKDTSLQRFEYGKRKAEELKEIVIIGKAKTKAQLLTEQYATEQFRNAEFTLVPDSNIAYASIWQYLLANVAGLQISGDLLTDPEVHFTRYTALRNFSDADATFVEDINRNRSSIAFYLNEVLVPIESITDLNPKDVALIKVNRNPNMGLNAPLGSIAIYTRKGLWWGRGEFSKSLVTGYNTARLFFSPQYASPDADVRSTDVRSTLYWNPALQVKNGTATFRFFKNDISKRLKLIVCGIDANGIPVYHEQILE